MTQNESIETLTTAIDQMQTVSIYGCVESVQGLLIEIVGPVHEFAIGSRLNVTQSSGQIVTLEVVGFYHERALCLPFQPIEGINKGSKAWLVESNPAIAPHPSWLGRVVNALGDAVDGKGVLQKGHDHFHLRAAPPSPFERNRIGQPLDLGVRALNSFTTCCEGQRMGIFAGSGVGKSVLMSMITRNMQADIAVIGLIGERGRELQDFLQDDLGEEGLKRAFVVAATSDESPLMRKQAALLTMTVAEYFRAQGKKVLLMMDSLTRFAQAQREVGLAAGEPPTSKGYTPTVFSELPKLLERAGPGLKGQGSITGLFTVLVEGDDHNEPIADAVRAIVDGHIVMERAIAERGRYPAINVLKSVSRTMPECVPEEMRPFLTEAKRFMSLYADMEELIRLGAYRKGSDPELDRAIALQDDFEKFLSQNRHEYTSWKDGYDIIKTILGTGQE